MIRRYVNDLWHSEFRPALSYQDTLNLLQSVPGDKATFLTTFACMIPMNDSPSLLDPEHHWTWLSNLYAACMKLFSEPPASTNPILNVPLLRELNKDVMKGISDQDGFRSHNASPAGYNVSYLTPKKIGGCLTSLLSHLHLVLEQVRQIDNPSIKLFTALRVGTVFFSLLLYIHPFDDGNGRTARLVLSYVLREFTIVPISLYCNEGSSKAYYEAVFKHHCDLTDFPFALEEFIIECAASNVRAADD
jgi:hypothetical protein